MIVSITQKDIDSGVPHTCTLCPVAIAVSRAFKGLKVSVSQDHIYVYERKSEARYIFKTPRRVSKFIDLFDTPSTVKPITFNLNNPIIRNN